MSDRELRRQSGIRRSEFVPDLVAELGRERLAVEVELSRKTRDRIRAKVDWYAGAGEYTQVCYFTQAGTNEQWLRRLIADHGAPASRFVVRPVPTPATRAPRAGGLESEIRAFLSSDPAERERMLAAWRARFEQSEAS